MCALLMRVAGGRTGGGVSVECKRWVGGGGADVKRVAGLMNEWEGRLIFCTNWGTSGDNLAIRN